MDEPHSFQLELEQQSEYGFLVEFDWPDVDELLLDESEPLGDPADPNAARLIGAAAANGLSSSQSLIRGFKRTPGMLRAGVPGQLTRNVQGQLRVGRYDVTIRLADEARAIQHFDRFLAQFEDFCVVTESVRHGIPIGVRIVDAGGVEVFAGGSPAQTTVAPQGG